MRRVGIGLFLWFLIAPALWAANYKVGFGKESIQPTSAESSDGNESRLLLFGYGSLRYGETVAYEGMELQVRAVYISKLDGSEPVVLAAADLVNICPADSDWARDPSRYTGATGLTRERILINITHTHNAPSSCESSARLTDPDFLVDAAYNSNWREFLRGKLVDAIQEAIDEAAEANLRFIRGKANIAVNRRSRAEELTDDEDDDLTTDGKTLIPGNENGYDHTLDVVEAKTDGGERLGVLFFYGAHPVALNEGPVANSLYYHHPDYPGFARKEIEDDTLADDTAIFFQAAGGDVNVADRGGLQDATDAGNTLGNAVLALLEETGTAILPAQGGNTARSRVWGAPLETAESLENIGCDRFETPGGLSGAEVDPPTGEWARWIALYCDEGGTGLCGEEPLNCEPCVIKAGIIVDKSIDTEFQTIKIGNWRVAGLSHEPVTMRGVELRNEFPEDLVSVAGYVGRTQNYLPTSAMVVQDEGCIYGSCNNSYEGYTATLKNGHPSPWATREHTHGLYDIDDEVLHVVRATTPERVNYALASHGSSATATSTLPSSNHFAEAVINDEKLGANWNGSTATGNGWHSDTISGSVDLDVDFVVPRTIDQIVIYAYDQLGSEPTDSTTYTNWGIVNFTVSYLKGSTYITAPGGAVTSNNKVKRTFSFAALTTTKIRIHITAGSDSYARIAEVQAWGEDNEHPARVNYALASNGAGATAYTDYVSDTDYASATNYASSRTPGAAINGDRLGVSWASDPVNGSGWHSTATHTEDTLIIDFDFPRTIDTINIFSVQDAYTSPSEPTETMTASLYQLKNFEVSYHNGRDWVALTGSITNNTSVWKKIQFPPLTTTKIKIDSHPATDDHSRITEVEAWGEATSRPNVALESKGSSASATSTLSGDGREARAGINGDRLGLDWGVDDYTGSGWHSNGLPATYTVTFAGPRTINQINVISAQDTVDNGPGPSVPTDWMTFTPTTGYGLEAFTVKYTTDGTNWFTVPGGAVTDNRLVIRKIAFPLIEDVTGIQVICTDGGSNYARIVELEALTLYDFLSSVPPPAP